MQLQSLMIVLHQGLLWTSNFLNSDRQSTVSIIESTLLSLPIGITICILLLQTPNRKLHVVLSMLEILKIEIISQSQNDLLLFLALNCFFLLTLCVCNDTNYAILLQVQMGFSLMRYLIICRVSDPVLSSVLILTFLVNGIWIQQVVRAKDITRYQLPTQSMPSVCRDLGTDGCLQSVLQQMYSLYVKDRKFLHYEKVLFINDQQGLDFYESNFNLKDLQMRNESTLTQREIFEILMDCTPTSLSDSLLEVLTDTKNGESYTPISNDSMLNLKMNSVTTNTKILRHVTQSPQSILTFNDIIDRLLRISRQRDIQKYVFTLQGMDSQYLQSNNLQVQLIPTNVNDINGLLIWLQMKKGGDDQSYLQQDHQLTNIFQSISHEFGTFLNLLTTLSEAGLEDPLLTDSIKDSYFKPMVINSQLLNLMLQNLRDYIYIVRDQLMLKIVQFDPLEQIQWLVDNLQETLNQRQIKCTIINNINTGQISVFNDLERFRQVFYQIFANSVRFTRHGEVEIILDPCGQQSLMVTIIDTGVGMSQDEQENLQSLLSSQKKFCKVSEQSVGGGLGLTISNELAFRISGTIKQGIKFESKQGEGSSFYFYVDNFVDEIPISRMNNDGMQRSFKVVCFNLNSYYEESLYTFKNPSSGSKGFRPASCSILKKNEMGSDIVAANFGKSQMSALSKTSSLFLNRLLPRDIDPREEESNMQSDDESSENSNQKCIPVTNPKFQDQIIKYSLSQQCCSKILIIDDEYFNILALKTIIDRRFKSKIDVSFNGYEAIELTKAKMQNPCYKCGNNGYLVYFIDINMPVMDGFQTVSHLKDLMNMGLVCKGICIANTGFVDLETKIRCFESGMDFYITKPVKISEVVDYISSVFH